MKNFLLLLLGLIIITLSVFAVWNRPTAKQPAPDTSSRVMLVGDTRIEVEIVDTPSGRELGLSHRESLESGQGMLFVFEKVGNYSFWMKDMNFSIDIVWIDENWRIVGVARDILPETYPASFRPPQPVRYVLEVPGGFFDAQNLSVGNLINFET
jgi:uncharacterized membrane protein (UPF0127 family)